MDTDKLLKPTLHVEVAVKDDASSLASDHARRQEIKEWIVTHVTSVTAGQQLDGFEKLKHAALIECVEAAEYTGLPTSTDYYNIGDVEVDVQTYTLRPEPKSDDRRSIAQQTDNELPQARILALPSIVLRDEWRSLIYDDALPARLLRYLVRMVGMMKHPSLNTSIFNWNRICLLHGPPGSGKSTLCCALAQKLSIRLGDVFAKSILIEINTNAMLSKYFGESGKLISGTFDQVQTMAQDANTLICVVMDEVETIAGSRERSALGGECNDGLRATNQLLTALDRIRVLPNVIVLCTSNLITAIDQAFLDRVDIKQLIPSPSPAAIYNIFRSCLNELIRSNLVEVPTPPVSTKARRKTRSVRMSTASPEPEVPPAPDIPTYAQMKTRLINEPQSPGRRVWAIAQKCSGLSGRTLRRLPILGLAMYTYGGTCSLEDAISALETAVNEEVKGKEQNIDVEMT